MPSGLLAILDKKKAEKEGKSSEEKKPSNIALLIEGMKEDEDEPELDKASFKKSAAKDMMGALKSNDVDAFMMALDDYLTCGPSHEDESVYDKPELVTDEDREG